MDDKIKKKKWKISRKILEKMVSCSRARRNGGSLVFKLSPTKTRDLTETLREVVNYAELEAIAVITKEGLHLAFFAAGEVDSDLLSAISAAILSTGEMAVDKMGFEKLSEVIVRGKSGYIILTDAGKFVLIGAGREATNLGLSVRVLRAYAKRVNTVLSKDDK